MKIRDGIFLRMAAGTGGHLLRTASGCLLVLAVSVANASNAGPLPVPPQSATVLAAAPPASPSIAIVSVAAPDFAAVCPGSLAGSLSATRPAHTRLALGVTDLPASEVLKTARLELPIQSEAAPRPASPALARSFISAANRQRAP